jgi:hypothetical protein
MSETNGTKESVKLKTDTPILQLNRLNYVKIGGRVLDSTGEKLDKYIKYASERMKTEVTSGDCLEHGLKLLFDRDTGFKDWLKQN